MRGRPHSRHQPAHCHQLCTKDNVQIGIARTLRPAAALCRRITRAPRQPGRATHYYRHTIISLRIKTFRRPLIQRSFTNLKVDICPCRCGCGWINVNWDLTFGRHCLPLPLRCKVKAWLKGGG